MKLIQNSEIRVFKSGIPQKSFTVDIMSWIHSLGPIGAIIIDIILLFNNYKKRKKSRFSGDHFLEVLLSPDEKISCNAYHFLSTGCRLAKRCKYDHNVNSMVKLLHFLLAAIKSVDVCLFNITCFELGGCLLPST